eukprot:TRINITY_DN4134_c0_g1_i5.p1 TRINITY_DN4134_c0_g1~~TRINITY_DN4134_c0_g1_i5.p1  ORF type:complete len:426 (-),score=34.04 TRINITY_DN4134_c0_g1_i5:226-1503(-)
MFNRCTRKMSQRNYTQGIVTVPSKIEINGRTYNLPLRWNEHREEILKGCQQSKVGIKGKGDQLDREIRNCVETTDFKGIEVDQDILRNIRDEIAPSAERIEARPYKLVVYEEGGLFKRHVDTVYEPDHFGSLAISLSTWYSGGELKFFFYENGEIKEEIPYIEDEFYFPKTNYTAWLTDIEHEVTAVESGARVVAIFNLYRIGNTNISKTDFHDFLDIQLQKIAQVDDEEVSSIGVILYHNYPLNGLQPDQLKSLDVEIYQTLKQIEPQIELVPIIEAYIANFIFQGEDKREYLNRPDSKSFKNWFRLCVIPTNNAQLGSNWDNEIKDIMKSYNYHIKNTIFLSLGGGEMLGGGFCYGNADCGTEWYYQHAAILIPIKELRRKGKVWKNLRPLFLIARKATKNFLISTLYNEYNGIFKRICKYMV